MLSRQAGPHRAAAANGIMAGRDEVDAMGLLVEGRWHDVWYDTKATQGRFVRSESQFRNWITRDGARARRAAAASAPSAAATTSTCRSRARGLTAC